MDFTRLFESLFLYSEESPLIFSRWSFWLFFGVLLAGYWLVERKTYYRTVYLTLFSLFFYYKTSGIYFTLLIAITALVYGLAIAIQKSQNLTTKKWLLALSVISSLFILFYLKYAFFIVEIFSSLLGIEYDVVNIAALLGNQVMGGDTFKIADVILPVGISFYTFQLISYTVDVYRQEVRAVKNLWNLMFYVSFFPQLVAGPIVRAKDFIAQIARKYDVTQEEFWGAVFLITTGMVKKIVFSDMISSNYIDKIFGNPTQYSAIELLFAVYGYAMQIYFDFSGYSDIAIGLALILGFRLSKNFDTPYQSVNISQFWRRWHISLSTWLKDYLYIPLGGNRKGKVRQYLNLLITMLIGGLWHGASVKFLLWGFLHGCLLAIHKLLLRFRWFVKLPVPKWIGILLTFHWVCLAWIFFRADTLSDALLITETLLTSFIHPIQIIEFASVYQQYTALLFASFVIVFLGLRYKNKLRKLFIIIPTGLKFVLLYVVILLLLFSQTSSSAPFIYFQF